MARPGTYLKTADRALQMLLCFGYEHPKRSSSQLAKVLGDRSPLRASASNKILLAYLPPNKIDEFIARDLESLIPHTMAEPAELKENLDEADSERVLTGPCRSHR
ncbi:MAG: hypothetical protein A2139_01360 [Desulfobacca sp. RBG_16_60_12]|nr:MAG: hypothetical protein A2139_01360 [Desulfobacca sp. RBG_16_60_12]